MIKDINFYEKLLLNLQRDPGNTDTDCMRGYATMKTLITDLQSNLDSDAEYYAGVAAKG